MALAFGVTVLPDPPYQRMIELFQLAERLGFDYAWTYDSDVLWQESMPALALAAQADERIKHVQLAQRLVFDYAWPYDSHVHWQQSMPTLALAAQATERIKLVHMVTNPCTR